MKKLRLVQTLSFKNLNERKDIFQNNELSNKVLMKNRLKFHFHLLKIFLLLGLLKNSTFISAQTCSGNLLNCRNQNISYYFVNLGGKWIPTASGPFGCMCYLNTSCQISDCRRTFCIDDQLSPPSLNTGDWFTKITGITGTNITELQAERINWIFCNSTDNSDYEQEMMEAIRCIRGLTSSCNSLSAAAIAAVPSAQGGIASQMTFYVPNSSSIQTFVEKKCVTSAPPACTITSITANPSPCNSSTNTYNVSGSISFTGAPNIGVLTVSINGGGSQTFYPPFSSSIPYNITGLSADGALHTITATFSSDQSCTKSTFYFAPNSCSVSPCSVSLTANPSSCNSSTNQYSLSGNISVSNPPSSGSLTVSVSGGGSQTFYAPFSSSITYSITGLSADGAYHTVTATFSNSSACTNSTSYYAPNSCSISPCSVSLSANPSSCNSSTNQYSLSGNISVSNPPSSGSLTVSVSGGGSQTFYAPFSSSIPYSITGLSADGAYHTVTATFSNSSSCTNSTSYYAPNSCSISPCSVSLTANPSTCNSSTNKYSLSGNISVSNPPSSGSLTVSVSGGGSQTFYAPFSSSISYNISGLTADGITHTVTASFSANSSCSNSTFYTAPSSCINYSCTVTLTAIPSSCNPATNTYTLTGRAEIFNGVGGSIIVISDGTNSQSYTVPNSQTSITWVDYTITGLTANGSIHTVTAVVSNGSSCQGSTTYTAPVSCLSGPCSISLTANASVCNSSNNQYSVYGNISVTNPPSSGSLTVSVSGGGSYTFYAPFSNTIPYNIFGLNSDGALHTVSASFSDNSSCNNSTFYFAPTTCNNLSCSATISANPGSCNSATNQYTLNGSVSVTNPPNSGLLTIQIIGGSSQYYSLPLTFPLSYSFSGLNSDGLSHTVEVSISGVNCSNTATYNAPPNCSLNCTLSTNCSSTPQSSCNSSNGTAIVNVNGGQGNISYTWSNGGNTATITGLSAGVYTVTVSDNILSGCTSVCSVSVANSMILPTASCSSTNNSNCNFPNGTATVSTNANQILWSNGGTSATISGLSAGTYTVTVTNTSTGCTNTCSTTVGISATLPFVICSKTDNSNCLTPNGTATVSTNANQILWSNGGTSATISGLSAGTYTVTVTNTSTGCTNICSTTVGSSATLPTATCSKTDNTNCLTPNGTATVSTNANQILWSNGSTSATISSLSAGTYTVTVTNTTTGCKNSCSTTISTSATLPTATCSKTDNSNCSTPNGTATVTTNANQILWSNGGTTATITGLSAGTYTVTVTSTTTGCTNTCSTTVGTAATLPTASCSKTDNSNCLTPNGSATVATNANQILWSNGGTTTTISGLSAGTYTVTVTNTATGCTNTCSTTVTNLASTLNVNCTSINPTCLAPNGGSVTATASGGTGIYTYIWSNGSSGQSISGLNAGTYYVTVNDGNNCKSTCSANLILPQGCCNISTDGLVIGNCNNKNTFTNSSDDEYTFTLNPTGTGIGSSYTVTGLPNSPITGNYGNPTTFGPYLISSGVKNITITDNTTSGCSKTVIITPPQSCSTCNLAPPVITVTDNICPSRIGSINILNSCGNDSQILYSTNNGNKWSSIKPFYSTSPMTIMAKCVSISDTTCKSSIITVSTSPKKCNFNTSECSLIVNTTINSCNNNKTENITQDDYFTIQVNATSANGGSSNRFEIVTGANQTDGTGGNVLNSGGTLYNSSVIVGQNKIFSANGISNYQLLVRDYDNNNCFKIIDISPVVPCSTNNNSNNPCSPIPCVPINIQKN